MSAASQLRRGFTTGACAAAAAKAAAQLLVTGKAPESVELDLPNGEHVALRVHRCERDGTGAVASVIKDAGDDPDVTHGAEIVAHVQFADGGEIEIGGGEGVGTVTKPGLQVPVGAPAINPVPLSMIRQAVTEVGPRGFLVTVSVPDGERLAAKTFNPRLGIVGGISIIGTTGRVEPKCQDAMKRSLVCALDVAKARGFARVAIVPGNLGERAVREHLDLDPDAVAQMSNFVGFMLDEAVARGFGEILLAGHPGKLAKLFAGDLDTHSSRSESAMPIVVETVRRLARGAGGRGHREADEPEAGDPTADTDAVADLERTETVEGVIQILDPTLLRAVFDDVAVRAAAAAEAHVEHKARVAAVLYNMAGRPVGWCRRASAWWRLD